VGPCLYDTDVSLLGYGCLLVVKKCWEREVNKTLHSPTVDLIFFHSVTLTISLWIYEVPPTKKKEEKETITRIMWKIIDVRFFFKAFIKTIECGVLYLDTECTFKKVIVGHFTTTPHLSKFYGAPQKKKNIFLFFFCAYLLPYKTCILTSIRKPKLNSNLFQDHAFIGVLFKCIILDSDLHTPITPGLLLFFSRRAPKFVMTVKRPPPKWLPKIGLLTARFIDSPMSCFYFFWDIKVFLRHQRNIIVDTILVGSPFKHHLIAFRKENSDGLLTLLVRVLHFLLGLKNILRYHCHQSSNFPISFKPLTTKSRNPVKHIV
jgi:hypothetical protein